MNAIPTFKQWKEWRLQSREDLFLNSIKKFL